MLDGTCTTACQSYQFIRQRPHVERPDQIPSMQAASPNASISGVCTKIEIRYECSTEYVAFLSSSSSVSNSTTRPARNFADAFAAPPSVLRRRYPVFLCVFVCFVPRILLPPLPSVHWPVVTVPAHPFHAAHPALLNLKHLLPHTFFFSSTSTSAKSIHSSKALLARYS